MSILVEAGSLSAAARRLGMLLATASRKVAELERHLKTRLLNRSSRQLTLTDAGQSHVTACRRILEQVGDAECAASRECRQSTLPSPESGSRASCPTKPHRHCRREHLPSCWRHSDRPHGRSTSFARAADHCRRRYAPFLISRCRGLRRGLAKFRYRAGPHRRPGSSRQAYCPCYTPGAGAGSWNRAPARSACNEGESHEP